MQECITKAEMRIFFLFLFFTLIGIGAVYFHYKRSTISDYTVQTPLAKNSAFSLSQAPSESLRGVIESLSGNISWQSRTATEETNINFPIPLQQGEVLETKVGKVTLSFPNIGKIDLFEDTKVSFIQTLPTHFLISQIQGRVEYKNEGINPISVQTLSLLMQQTNGNMIINTDLQQSQVKVSIVAGSALVAFNDANNKSTIVNLHTGDTYIFDDSKKEGNVL